MRVPTKQIAAKNISENRRESAADLEEQISRRAYELYERRGYEHGHEVEDWLQAEAELAAERNQPVAVAAVEKIRKTPVASTGKTKARQVKKSRSPAQTKTLAE
jgi:DUF2934 family protein